MSRYKTSVGMCSRLLSSTTARTVVGRPGAQLEAFLKADRGGALTLLRHR